LLGLSATYCGTVGPPWLNLARIAHGPLFHRVTKNGKQPGVDRLNDKHIVRLVKRTALAAACAGISPKLTESGNLQATRCALHWRTWLRDWQVPPCPQCPESDG